MARELEEGSVIHELHTDFGRMVKTCSGARQTAVFRTPIIIDSVTAAN